MADIKEVVTIIDNLTELTQNHKISWKRVDPENLLSTENKIDFVYIVKYLGRLIRIYEEEYKFYTDEEIYHWSSRVVTEFVDEYGNMLWRFPKTRNAWDLLNSIRYEDVNVDGFLSEMLKNKT